MSGSEAERAYANRPRRIPGRRVYLGKMGATATCLALLFTYGRADEFGLGTWAGATATVLCVALWQLLRLAKRRL